MDENDSDKKYCQITFDQPDSATKALTMNGKKVINKVVRVEPVAEVYEEEEYVVSKPFSKSK